MIPFFLIYTTDPFYVLKECTATDKAAASLILLEDITANNVIVVSYDEMITMRGRGAMSWVDESRGA